MCGRGRPLKMEIGKDPGLTPHNFMPLPFGWLCGPAEHEITDLAAMFKRDLDDSETISMEKWEQRSLAERMKEMFSRSLGYWL